MIIEFNGLPASGKTTLCERLSEEAMLKDQKIVLYRDVLLKKGNPFRFIQIITKISLVELWYFYIIAKCTDQKLDRKQIHRIFLAERVCITYKWMRDSSVVNLVDQGILQAIASIIFVYYVRDWNKIELYTKRILDRYDISYINAISPVSLSMERMKLRNDPKSSRLDSIDKMDILQDNLTRMLGSIEHLRAIIKNSNMPCFSVNMEESLEYNIDRLLSFIR